MCVSNVDAAMVAGILSDSLSISGVSAETLEYLSHLLSEPTNTDDLFSLMRMADDFTTNTDEELRNVATFLLEIVGGEDQVKTAMGSWNIANNTADLPKNETKQQMRERKRREREKKRESRANSRKAKVNPSTSTHITVTPAQVPSNQTKQPKKNVERLQKEKHATYGVYYGILHNKDIDVDEPVMEFVVSTLEDDTVDISDVAEMITIHCELEDDEKSEEVARLLRKEYQIRQRRENRKVKQKEKAEKVKRQEELKKNVPPKAQRPLFGQRQNSKTRKLEAEEDPLANLGEAPAALVEMFPDHDKQYLSYVNYKLAEGSVVTAAELLTDEHEESHNKFLKYQLQRRLHIQEEKDAEKREQMHRKQVIEKFSYTSTKASARPDAVLNYMQRKQPRSKLRFRDGQTFNDGKKYVVENVSKAWDGGSRGKH